MEEKEKSTTHGLDGTLTDQEMRDACRVYNAIKTITRSGCDAEIKQINGTLKILSVKKSVPKEFKNIIIRQ